MAQKALIRTFVALLLIVLIAGCSSAQKSRLPDDPDSLFKGEATKENVGDLLEMKVASQIRYMEQNSEEFKKQVVSLPSNNTRYHFKYYDEFPGGSDNIAIAIKPLDKVNILYKGEVKYRKIRYQTRLATSSGKASGDENFIRDEGVQREVYEFDGSLWRLKSSVFEVRKTSVYREDRWRAAQGRIRRVEEEEPELFVDKVRNLFGLID